MKLLACALESSANLHLRNLLAELAAQNFATADSNAGDSNAADSSAVSSDSSADEITAADAGVLGARRFFASNGTLTARRLQQNPAQNPADFPATACSTVEQISLFGIFDTAKFSAQHAYCDFREFNAMGFIEVLPLILKAKRAIKSLVATALSERIDSVLLIDSPAFNIPLARELRRAGYSGRIVYFILPQVWAWKASRVRKLAPLCDALVGILPFERGYWGEKFYYFGNPISATTAPYLRSAPAASPQRKIAFLPGSRKREIASLMPIFRELAALIRRAYPECRLLLSRANAAADYGDCSLFEDAPDALAAVAEADFAYVCSGTASLQTALIGTPFALVYRARTLDFLIAKTFVKISHIGLANIIASRAGYKAMHAEYIQNFSAAMLFSELERANGEEFFAASKRLRELLGEQDTRKIANLIINKE